MKTKKNIWIVYNSRKGGHTYPSRALSDYLTRSAPKDWGIQVINLLEYSEIISFLDVVGRYGDLNLKWLYKKGYQSLRKESQLLIGGYRLAESLLFSAAKLTKKLEHRFGKPAIIISLQPEVNVIAALLKKRLAVPIHTIVVDLAMHGLWINEDIDHYYVANIPLKQELIDYKVKPDNISVTGIPLRAGFSEIVNDDIKATRKRLGVVQDLPTILLIGGLLGTMIDFHSIIQAVMKLKSPFQVLAIFGENEEEKARAEATTKGSKNPFYLFGRVENVDEMMWASDIIVSKPGSVTMAEALSLGKPMIVITPRAGSAQEIRFAKFLQNNNAGEWISSAAQLEQSLCKIFDSKARYEMMCRNAWQLGHHSLSANKTIFENIKKALE